VDVVANPVTDIHGATAQSGLRSPDGLPGPGSGRILDESSASQPAALADVAMPATAGSATSGTSGTSGTVTVPRRSAPDRFARWVLRIHEPPDGQEVHNLFSASMALSGTRCLLSYIVLPVLAPWLGAVPFIGPAIGVPIGVLALVFDVRAIRRFFQSDHRWRWVAAALYLAVMALVVSLIFRDISRLV
jgi:hypothetical protein